MYIVKKRVLSCLLALLLLSLLAAGAFAAPNRVLDGAMLMTEEEVAALRAKADSISASSGLDVVILTVDTTGGEDPQAFADDYYDESGYRDDGIVFLWPAEERELTISTKGRAIDIFTDYGIDGILDAVTPYFLNEDYAGGFGVYLDMAADYIEQAENGEPYDTYVPDPGQIDPIVNPPVPVRKPARFSFFWLVVSLLLGFLLGGVPLAKHKKAVQNVALKTNASDYTRPESFELSRANDVFLYQNVTRVPRASSSDSSSGGGSGRSGGGGVSRGGSTTHVSSSGSVHGGGSRKI